MEDRLWIAGPLELLRHGLNHKNNSSDFDSRIAFISIDNGVELMIKTYLSLPKRITKIEGLSRRKYEEISESFPQLINALEDYAGDQVESIDLGKIEWFHQLRNTLYYQGNGITVEKERSNKTPPKLKDTNEKAKNPAIHLLIIKHAIDEGFIPENRKNMLQTCSNTGSTPETCLATTCLSIPRLPNASRFSGLGSS